MYVHVCILICDLAALSSGCRRCLHGRQIDVQSAGPAPGIQTRKYWPKTNSVALSMWELTRSSAPTHPCYHGPLKQTLHGPELYHPEYVIVLLSPVESAVVSVMRRFSLPDNRRGSGAGSACRLLHLQKADPPTRNRKQTTVLRPTDMASWLYLLLNVGARAEITRPEGMEARPAGSPTKSPWTHGQLAGTEQAPFLSDHSDGTSYGLMERRRG
jgi:hypothetical protein